MDLVLVGNMKCTLQVQLCVCSYELGGVEPELISANIIPQLPWQLECSIVCINKNFLAQTNTLVYHTKEVIELLMG